MSLVAENLGSICFICRQKVQKSAVANSDKANTIRDDGSECNKKAICQKFMVLSSRYLDLKTGGNPKKTLGSDALNNDGFDEGQACDDCFPTLDSFCDMYELLQHLKLELNRNMEKVSESIRKSNEEVPHADKFPVGQPEDVINRTTENLEKFRKSFVAGVDEKKQSQFPQLPLNDISKLVSSKRVRVRGQLRSKKEQFQCRTCGKCLSTRQALTNHDLIHGRDKPTTSKQIKRRAPRAKVSFKCRFCGKCLARRQALIDHENIHSGIKPYECLVCFRKFRVNSTLVVHSRIHTGEKPFKCHSCPRRFRQRGYMTVHIREKHGGKKSSR